MISGGNLFTGRKVFRRKSKSFRISCARVSRPFIWEFAVRIRACALQEMEHTSGSSDAMGVEASDIPCTLEYSSRSLPPKTCRSSGIESSRADFRDMVMVATAEGKCGGDVIKRSALSSLILVSSVIMSELRAVIECRACTMVGSLHWIPLKVGGLLNRTVRERGGCELRDRELTWHHIRVPEHRGKLRGVSDIPFFSHPPRAALPRSRVHPMFTPM
jgi:hypothetical protein